jgi:hypothetical protein
VPSLVMLTRQCCCFRRDGISKMKYLSVHTTAWNLTYMVLMFSVGSYSGVLWWGCHSTCRGLATYKSIEAGQKTNRLEIRRGVHFGMLRYNSECTHAQKLNQLDP